MIPWKTYAGRRNINLALVIDNNTELSDYNALSEHYRVRGVEPPTEEEYATAANQIREKEKIAGVEKIKKTGMSPDGRRLKKGENPEEVWNNAVDGSYGEEHKVEQTKKKVTRKKTATRKASTSKTSKKS